MTEENTDFVTFTTSGASDAADSNKNGDKMLKTNTNSVLPDTLLEWLAVIALLFILIVLGRTIYASIIGDTEEGH